MNIPCNLTNCESCIAYLNRECIINKAYKQGRANALNDLFNTEVDDKSLEQARYDETCVDNEYNKGWNACFDVFKETAERLKAKKE